MFKLASSFRLRNKIKERISGLIAAIECAEFNKTAGTEENISPCDGKTLEEAVAEVHALMDILQELNNRIEKANAVNKNSLIILETLKSKIAFYEKVLQKCRHGRKYEFEYDEKGERVKVDKEPLVNQKAVAAVLSNLKKEKDHLEEKIATVHFNTDANFDPEKILSRIWDIVMYFEEFLFIIFSLIKMSFDPFYGFSNQRDLYTLCPITSKNLQ
jgi:hypothetical protein